MTNGMANATAGRAHLHTCDHRAPQKPSRWAWTCAPARFLPLRAALLTSETTPQAGPLPAPRSASRAAAAMGGSGLGCSKSTALSSPSRRWNVSRCSLLSAPMSFLKADNPSLLHSKLMVGSPEVASLMMEQCPPEQLPHVLSMGIPLQPLHRAWVLPESRHSSLARGFRLNRTFAAFSVSRLLPIMLQAQQCRFDNGSFLPEIFLMSSG